jgi:hypothetical protein
MNPRKPLWIALGLGIAVWMTSIAFRFERQRRELTGLRENQARAVTPTSPPLPKSSAPPNPSDELLRARGEVAQLRRERLENPGQTTAPNAGVNAIGSDPSDSSTHPDYRTADSLQNRGFATPDDALESFLWHFAKPGRMKPPTEGGMDLLWHTPDRPAPRGFHWRIDLGFGFTRLEGFRIRARREISPEEVAFEIERKENDHNVVEIRRIIRVGDVWKCEPEMRLEPNTP